MSISASNGVGEDSSRVTSAGAGSSPTGAWHDRVTWRRGAVANGRSGTLDPPGSTWRDRPAIDRGDGVYLAGDMVAAPGLLSEVSVSSALTASRGALVWAGMRPDAMAVTLPAGGAGRR